METDEERQMQRKTKAEVPGSDRERWPVPKGKSTLRTRWKD